MKNLVTSALLFAGLTISAQSPIEERYEVFDTIPDNGIDFVAKFEAAFVDMDNRTDTIIVYPFISYYEFDGFKIEGIWLAFLNKFEKVKGADFVFEKETVALRTCKNQDQTKFDKKYIMSAKSNVKPDAFLTSLYMIKFNGKTYVPINNCDVYFTYMLGVIEGLKTNWLK